MIYILWLIYPILVFVAAAKKQSINTNLYSPYLEKMNNGLNGFGMSSFMKKDQYPTQPAFTANQVADVFQNVSWSKDSEYFSTESPVQYRTIAF